MRRLALLALALAVWGCSTDEATDHTTVELLDGSIGASSTTLQAGAVTIDVSNVGEFRHTLVVTTGQGSVVAATGLLDPGDGARLEVSLAPGDYQFTCRIVAQDGEGNVIDHYQNGMVTNVDVG